MKKIFLFILLFTFCYTNSFSDNPYFVNFSKVLNTSKAGAAAQKILKNKFEVETKKFRKQEEDIRKEESEIITQKKIITKDVYQKKVETLRKKFSKLQSDKKKSFNAIAKSRGDSKEALLKAINPIMRKYMKEKNIRIVLDKKSVLLADKSLEITDQIIEILNKEIPSLKIN
jgi:Skp family chaperone for outer membrane proteins